MPPWEPFRSTTPTGGPQNPARFGHTEIVSMLTISTNPRKIAVRSAVALSLVMVAWMSGAACSSSSSSEFPDVSQDGGGFDAGPPTCTTPIVIGAGNDQTNIYPGGACSSAKGTQCTYAPPDPCTTDTGFEFRYTCTCDGASWSCSTGGAVPDGPCDSGSDAEPSDAGDDADLDASDASDGDAS